MTFSKVLRMNFYQLGAEEQRLDESVMAHWEAFLVELQEAVDFVNVQTPLVTQSLDNVYQVRVVINGHFFSITKLLYMLSLAK